MEVDREKDLPLMANGDEIRVRHYMLKLYFDMEKEIVQGQAIMFCDTNISNKNPKEFILDCKDLITTSVYEIVGDDDEFNQILNSFDIRSEKIQMDKWFHKSRRPLEFKSEPWCLRIFDKPDSTIFPRIFYVEWTTLKGAKSLLWRNDQNGEKCVFTPAAAVNNR